jgi:thiol-disulfide isomerase/thioredoxin
MEPSSDPPNEAALWAIKMISVALALIFTVSGVIHLDQVKARYEPVVPGAMMPDFQLPRLTSDPEQKKNDVRLADFRGKIVLIDFWATWCPPCMRALPQLERLYSKYKDKNVVFIGINREPHQRRKALAAVKSLGLSFPQATDRRTGTPAGYGEKVGVQSLPTAMLLDPEGQITKIHIGYTDPELIETELLELLGKGR